MNLSFRSIQMIYLSSATIEEPLSTRDSTEVISSAVGLALSIESLGGLKSQTENFK